GERLPEGAIASRYALERSAPGADKSALKLPPAYKPVGPIQRALELIGNPASTESHPVRAPMRANQDPEQETFRWFVDNDGAEQPQSLKPIPPTGPLPPLGET